MIKYSMFFQFSFEIRGQNSFPDNHWGEGGGGQGKSLRIKREILEGTVWPYLNVGLFDTR